MHCKLVFMGALPVSSTFRISHLEKEILAGSMSVALYASVHDLKLMPTSCVEPTMHCKLVCIGALPCSSTFSISHLEKETLAGSMSVPLKASVQDLKLRPTICVEPTMHCKLVCMGALPCSSTFSISHLEKEILAGSMSVAI